MQYIIGAYATSPLLVLSDKSLEIKFYDKLIDSIPQIRGIGLTINWARSATKGRSVNTPILHLKIASVKRLLSRLIFSGVSSNDGLYGEWKDTHAFR